MKIKEILQESIKQLKANEVEEPHAKARRLLAFTLEVPKEYLIINYDKEISKKQETIYKQYIKNLLEGEPIQYILGKQEFMGIEFAVNKDVLIPQPDTEILVEEVIKLLKQYKKPKILDLCTGSGAIAISISEKVSEAQIYASDISEKALAIARINDRSKKIKFILSDLFNNIEDKFDIIVSNPPYIKTHEIEKLSKEVQNEPILALDGGIDGLEFYRKIIGQASKYIKKNGYLCLEIGEKQKKQVKDIINNEKKYADIKEYKDLNKNDRVIICKKT